MTDFYAAVVEAFIGEPAFPTAEGHRQGVADAAAFARDQIRWLPVDLRLGLLAGLTAFRLIVLGRHLRPFERLPAATRRRLVLAWACGSNRFARQLFRPIRSTALIAYYEHAHLASGRPA
jgi:hypothetical protein